MEFAHGLVGYRSEGGSTTLRLQQD
jgi:hypothetical protein